MNDIKTTIKNIAKDQTEQVIRCDWTDCSEYYETECKKSFYFSDGSLFDNGFKYCPYCGKLINEVN